MVGVAGAAELASVNSNNAHFPHANFGLDLAASTTGIECEAVVARQH